MPIVSCWRVFDVGSFGIILWSPRWDDLELGYFWH